MAASDKDFLIKFQKCLTLCKEILALKGNLEMDCLDKLESYLRHQIKLKEKQDRLLEEKEFEEMRRRLKKITSEFEENRPSFSTSNRETFEPHKYREFTKNIQDKQTQVKNKKRGRLNNWNIEVRVRLSKPDK